MPPWFNIFATGFGCAFATLGLCALVALCLLPNAAAADRKYGNLIYPARGNIELDEGTAEIWLISGFDSEPEKKDAASACSAFNLIFPSNNAKYVLNFITWGKSFAQVGYGPLQHSYVWTRPLVWKPGEFHHLAWTWSGRKRSVYQHPTMVTTQVHGSAVQRFNGWKSMKIEHFEDIEVWPACQGAGRQLARELTRLRGRSHFGVAKSRKYATPVEKITVNREP